MLAAASEPAPQPEEMSNSEECYFCGQRVYVLERISAEGKFFHRSCFTCHQCCITLRLGGYTFDQTTGEVQEPSTTPSQLYLLILLCSLSLCQRDLEYHNLKKKNSMYFLSQNDFFVLRKATRREQDSYD